MLENWHRNGMDPILLARCAQMMYYQPKPGRAMRDDDDDVIFKVKIPYHPAVYAINLPSVLARTMARWNPVVARIFRACMKARISWKNGEEHILQKIRRW